MTEARLWVAALVVPAPLYAALLVLERVSPGDPTILVGFALTVLFCTVTAVGLLRHRYWVNAGRTAFLLLVVLPIAYSRIFGPTGVDLSAGVLLGSPLLWIGYTWDPSSSFSARLVALEGSFLVGILCLAANSAATFPPGSSPGEQFVTAVGSVISGQVQGVTALLFGGTPASMPLESVLDVGYVVLGTVAIVGTLAGMLAPQTALAEPLPWSIAPLRSSTEPVNAVDERLALRPGQREALATRTQPRAPGGVISPGFASVIVASFLALGFVVLAASVPSITLLVFVLGVVGAILAVALVLSRRLTSTGGLEG